MGVNLSRHWQRCHYYTHRLCTSQATAIKAFTTKSAGTMSTITLSVHWIEDTWPSVRDFIRAVGAKALSVQPPTGSFQVEITTRGRGKISKNLNDEGCEKISTYWLMVWIWQWVVLVLPLGSPVRLQLSSRNKSKPRVPRCWKTKIWLIRWNTY